MLGAASGAVLVWLVLRAVGSGAGPAAVAELRARLEERSVRAAALEAECAELQRRTAELAVSKERLAAELEHERRAGTEKLALLADAETKLREAFQSLSAEALRQNNQSFLDLARTSLGEF